MFTLIHKVNIEQRRKTFNTKTYKGNKYDKGLRTLYFYNFTHGLQDFDKEFYGKGLHVYLIF